jgi:hypothetical protein
MNTMQDALLRANVITTQDVERVKTKEQAEREFVSQFELAVRKLKIDFKQMIDRDISDEVAAFLLSLALHDEQVFKKIMCEFSYRAAREPEQVPVYLKEIGCAANSWAAARS